MTVDESHHDEPGLGLDLPAQPLEKSAAASPYRVLARKYRPQSFGELIGQDLGERLLGVMGRTRTGPQRLKAGTPPGWLFAHKTGTGQVLGSLGTGPVRLAPGTVLQALLGGATEAQRVIVTEIRLPRALLALVIGATLGLAGAALQGLLRNPLASPSLFGAPQAAAFGAVATISLGVVDSLSWGLPAAAIAGAFLSVFLLLAVAGRGAGLLLVILAGLAVSSLAGAATALAMKAV